MKRKEIVNLAVSLIEEALEKPNQKIILEDRITKPICEIGIKEPTEKELGDTRKNLMKFVFYMSNSPLYGHDVEATQRVLTRKNYSSKLEEYVCYTNGSKIILRR